MFGYQASRHSPQYEDENVTTIITKEGDYLPRSVNFREVIDRNRNGSKEHHDADLTDVGGTATIKAIKERHNLG